ncbi:MAG TPA: enoyl-CoA hydratase/isomerase family protein [Burkholderiaceae bacterium]|nr:enoyl-CoA hydratase/isomerase family protein [Burkholderiaceae bacterium]
MDRESAPTGSQSTAGADASAGERHYELDRSSGIAVFRITRPRRLNAITMPVLAGLEHCVDELEAAGGRGLIVTAEGERAFCAGTDLAEMQSMPDQAMLAKSRRARELFFRIQQARFVSVAAINGLALGGGLELALACTFRVAAAHATFGLPEIKLGVLPAYGGTQFLPPVVGPALALDLMLTGRTLDAQQALAAGLISRIAADAQAAFDEARALLTQVNGYSNLAVDEIRRCVQAAAAGVTAAGLAVEDEAVRRCMTSADAKEGVSAFLQKRPARFNQG